MESPEQCPTAEAVAVTSSAQGSVVVVPSPVPGSQAGVQVGGGSGKGVGALLRRVLEPSFLCRPRVFNPRS